jgi:AraC family transcriptional regulator of adaptative response / methylphosphotriester-DNA alkyltransferase methyltransferase
MTFTNQIKNSRGQDIAQDYLDFLDRHISDVVSGKVPDFLELNQIANELSVSHGHLSDTIRKEKGHHPCYFYDLKIVNKTKVLLTGTSLSVAEIAKKFTYDPSNFGKFFKKWTGETPGNFRKMNQLPKTSPYF